MVDDSILTNSLFYSLSLMPCLFQQGFGTVIGRNMIAASDMVTLKDK